MAQEICQHCDKNPATIHVTEIVGTDKHQMHVCEACAQVLGLQHDVSMTVTAKVQTESGRRCPQCGMTFDKFRAKGRLGCPKDYEVFEDLLLPVLRKAHAGRDAHVGRLPKGGADITSTVGDRLLQLRRDLQEAVGHERYEEAARIRDEIQSLETNPGERAAE